jgi:sulfur relay (sulfurtransferase) complex TusBCD TusD component (DsrE family)
MARGVTEKELEEKNAQLIGPDDLADLMLEADRVISF